MMDLDPLIDKILYCSNPIDERFTEAEIYSAMGWGGARHRVGEQYFTEEWLPISRLLTDIHHAETFIGLQLPDFAWSVTNRDGRKRCVLWEASETSPSPYAVNYVSETGVGGVPDDLPTMRLLMGTVLTAIGWEELRKRYED